MSLVPLRLNTQQLSHLIQRTGLVAGSIGAATACGVLAVLFEPTQRGMLIGVIGVVLLLPLAIRITQKRLRLLEPLTIMCVALFVMFCVRPTLLVLNDQMTFNGYNIEPYFDEALVVALIACIAFVVGYAVPFGHRIGERIPPLARSGWHLDTLVVYAFGLFVLGTLLYGVFIVQSGGLDTIRSLLEGRQPEQDSWYRSSTGYFYQARMLAIPASLLLVASGLYMRRPLLIVVAVLMVVPLMLLGSATGGRLSLMVLLTPPAIFALFYTGRRPPTWIMLAGLYLLLTVGLAFLGDQRDADGRTESRMAVLAESVTHPGSALDRVFLGGDTEMFDGLAVELSVVPEALPYQHGAILTDILVRAVPRPLWPSKPLESNDQLITALWPEHYSVNRASAATSIVGSLYLDSGLATVIAGMFVIGAASRGLWTWLIRWPHTPGVQMLFSTLLPLFVVLVRGNITHTLSIALFTVLPVVIGLWIAQRQFTRQRQWETPFDRQNQDIEFRRGV